MYFEGSWGYDDAFMYRCLSEYSADYFGFEDDVDDIKWKHPK